MLVFAVARDPIAMKTLPFSFPRGHPHPPTHWSIAHWEFKAGPDLVLVHVSGCFADMLSMLCYAMLPMLWSKGPGAPTLTGAAHSLSTRRVCTCVAFREKDPRARSVVVFSLNTDARGLLPERPTALGSFHVASGEEAALCEHPGVVILA